MSSGKSVNNHAAVAARPPATVWILTLLLGAMAFVSVVGSFLFAFPLGGLLGYATIAWRLRHWLANAPAVCHWPASS